MQPSRGPRSRVAVPLRPPPRAPSGPPRSGALPLAVGSRLVDEASEESEVLARLGMPEDADGEAPRRILERLDGAVVGAGRREETLAESVEPLMVVRLHGGPVAEERRDLRPGLDVDLVVGEHARRVLVVLVADLIRKVLEEIAAPGDVQHLGAATDREQRHVAFERGAHERELGLVPVANEPERLLVRVLAVELG